MSNKMLNTHFVHKQFLRGKYNNYIRKLHICFNNRQQPVTAGCAGFCYCQAKSVSIRKTFPKLQFACGPHTGVEMSQFQIEIRAQWVISNRGIHGTSANMCTRSHNAIFCIWLFTKSRQSWSKRRTTNATSESMTISKLSSVSFGCSHFGFAVEKSRTSFFLCRNKFRIGFPNYFAQFHNLCFYKMIPARGPQTWFYGQLGRVPGLDRQLAVLG